jgi:hypothetical protein
MGKDNLSADAARAKEKVQAQRRRTFKHETQLPIPGLHR